MKHEIVIKHSKPSKLVLFTRLTFNDGSNQVFDARIETDSRGWGIVYNMETNLRCAGSFSPIQMELMKREAKLAG